MSERISEADLDAVLAGPARVEFSRSLVETLVAEVRRLRALVVAYHDAESGTPAEWDSSDALFSEAEAIRAESKEG